MRQLAIKAGLILTALGLTSFQSTTYSTPSALGDGALSDSDHAISQADLASLSRNNKIQRQTEFGQIVPTRIKGKDQEIMVLLKDPAMSKAWGVKTTDTERAWRVSTGSKDIRVAVIDTGIDVNHPDLKNNLWTNPGETGVDKDGRDRASNGVDDDGNGFIDDVHGWNFVGNNSDLTDNHGHGTHIAGIIGAEGGNGIGAAGISPHVSIMVLKYYDPKAQGMNNLYNTVRAINYAVQMNAHIINYSGGGVEASPEEKRAIEMAMKKGILVVAAAGNERSNSDIAGYYPADYNLDNIISVTAINQNKTVLPTSNWGEKSVDIAAPGDNIYSTLPGGRYGLQTGTSQATAFVSGVAALVMANNSELQSAERIIKYLTQTGDTHSTLVGKTRYHKILNSYKALAIQDRDLSINGVRAENTTHMQKAFIAGQALPFDTTGDDSHLNRLGADLNKLLNPANLSGSSTSVTTNE